MVEDNEPPDHVEPYGTTPYAKRWHGFQSTLKKGLTPMTNGKYQCTRLKQEIKTLEAYIQNKTTEHGHT